MYHLKMLSPNTHPRIENIIDEIANHPMRPYTIRCDEYDFTTSAATKIKNLLSKNCNICFHSTDNFLETKIEEFINAGKEHVILHPKDFAETDMFNHLKNGASAIFSFDDGFDLFQIKMMAKEGKGNVTIYAKDLPEEDIADYLKEGANILIHKEDGYSRAAIIRLSKIGGNQMNVHAKGFNSFWLKKFLKEKALVTIGDGNILLPDMIKRLVGTFQGQIFLSEVNFQDKNWLLEMENLKAVIV